MDRLRKYSDRAAWIALALGTFFFVWLVLKIGPDAVRAAFHGNARGVLGIALVYGLFQAAYCLGWRQTLPSRRISYPRLFGIYLAGDTASYVLPLSGEPLKARLLNPPYSTTEGLASVSVAKFCEFVAQLVFYAVGLTLTLFAFPLPLKARAAGVGVALALAAGLALLFWRQRRGLYAPFLDLWAKVFRRSPPAGLRDKVEELDRSISLFHSESPRRLALCVLFKFIGKLGGAAEAALVLLFLGHRPSVASAFAVETLAMLANDAVFFIPGRVGGAEGGRVLVFLMLGYGAAEGLAYAIIRRLRELLWVGAGLAFLLYQRLGRPARAMAAVTEPR